MIKKYEEISMNAWPALQTVLYNGWLLRFSNNVTRRANSICPLYESNVDVNKKIDYCEKLYRDNNQKIVYKITPQIYPKNLDSLLFESGYIKEATTSMQSVDISKTMKNEDNQNIVTNRKFDDDWLTRLIDFMGTDKSKFIGYKNILTNIKMETCYIDLIEDGVYIGCGLGVVEEDFIGIFDVVVDKKERNKGYGYQIITSILNYGYENGATKGYLQVVLDNKSALHLYQKIGFKEEYQYWYRVKGL